MKNCDRPVPRVLTIAGSDSGGGAGIQADLKTFSAFRCYGMSVITSITAQNTFEVSAIHPVPVAVIEAQLDAVVGDIGVDAVKIGMMGGIDVIETVARRLAHFSLGNVVLDPVMISKSGDSLLARDAIDALRALLLPQATLLTPNLPEAEALLGRRVASEEEMMAAARDLAEMGPRYVVVKGGHRASDESGDVLFCRETGMHRWLPASRIASRNTHGTGCTFSSAIAAAMATGLSPMDAVCEAKDYITCAIRGSAEWSLGRGHGPVHHFVKLW